jgi:hypothetical protein
MRMPTIALPVIRNYRFGEKQGLKGDRGRKIVAALQIYNPQTRGNCEAACDRHSNFGVPRESCIHECYWETDWWKSKCGGLRYCN